MRLFDAGLAEITARTRWPSLGVVPWLAAAGSLPAEDAVALERMRASADGLHVVVPMLSRIANFDDFDALAQEPGVRLQMIPPGSPLPATAQVVILPGTKSTLADLRFLRAQGWDVDILAHVRRGGRVAGICGGFQMLGKTIADIDGVEGDVETVDGLGLLPVHTRLMRSKQVREVRGRAMAGGAVNADGLVAGCYVHGLFNHAAFRGDWLRSLGAASDGIQQCARVDAALDQLAQELERALDLDLLLGIARSPA